MPDAPDHAGNRLADRPPCTLCGGTDTRMQFQKDGYKHYHCHSCRGLFVFPIPSSKELADFYRKTEGEQTSSLCWTSSRRHVWSTWRWALGRIERHAGRGPVLDVGCGAGQFLAFAGDQGWNDLAGLELSPQAAEIARRHTDATIHTVDLVEAGLPAESFAGVTLWDVVEHLADPHVILREVRRVLRPGGAIVVSVPHRYGLAMRILKHRALIVMPPEHLAYYARRTMRRLLDSEGFLVKGTHCLDIYLREWTRLLSRAEGGDSQKGTAYQSSYERLVQSRLFLIAMRLANVFLRMTTLGDQLIAVGQKRGD